MSFARFMGSIYLGALLIAAMAIGGGVAGWLGALAGGALAVGLVLLIAGCYGDPARGRKRCPKCWYDMSGTPGLVCPECGRDARRPERLMKGRRRWRLAAAGLVPIAAGFAPTVARWVRDGWYLAHLPRPALMVCVWWPTKYAWSELRRREVRDQITIDPETGHKLSRYAWVQLHNGSPDVSRDEFEYLVAWGAPNAEMETFIRATFASGDKAAQGAILGGLESAPKHDPGWCNLMERVGTDRTLPVTTRSCFLLELTHRSPCCESGIATRALRACEEDADPRMQRFAVSELQRMEALNREAPPPGH